jgi:hypothetical protein
VCEEKESLLFQEIRGTNRVSWTGCQQCDPLFDQFEGQIVFFFEKELDGNSSQLDGLRNVRRANPGGFAPRLDQTIEMEQFPFTLFFQGGVQVGDGVIRRVTSWGAAVSRGRNRQKKNGYYGTS